MKLRFYLVLLLFLWSRSYGQNCTLAVSLASSGTAICSGNAVTLTATPSGGIGPYTYIWSTGETTQSISVNKAGNYSITVSDNTPGCQPVNKSINITASPTPAQPVVKNAVVCQNTSATLTATSPGGSYQWYDAVAGGNFLGNGATYVTGPIAVATTFYVETTIGDCTSARTAVSVDLNGKATVTNAVVCVGSTATLSATGGQSYLWYDAASGGNLVGTGANFTTPPLLKTTVYYLSAVISGCAGQLIPVTATVTPPPQVPVVSNTSVCYSTATSLHADVPTGLVEWYDVPVGGTPLIISPDFTTPLLKNTATYYVQTSLNTCESSRIPVTVTVNPIPALPAVQNVSICYGSKTVLSVTSTGTAYQWFDSAAGSNLLATGNTFITPILNSSTTYYVRSIEGSCVSDLVPVNVTVNTPPPAPVVSAPLICYGTSAILTPTTTGGTYQWYDAATGGNLLAAGSSYVTAALIQNTTYYVQNMAGGCISQRVPVTVSVLPLVPAPSALNTTICSGSFAVLTAMGSGGGYGWYDSASGGNLLSAQSTLVTPALSVTTTYYVENTMNGCLSARTPVTVTVNPFPSSPAVTNVSVCPGSPATLTAVAPSGGMILWYDAAIQGNLIATGNTFTTPPVFDKTIYYVENATGGCSSPRVPVIVSVYFVPNTQFFYQSGIVSTSGSNPSPILNNPYGGTFSASPAGLVFTDNKTGQINAAASTPGKYIITFVNNGPCVGSYSSVITVLQLLTGGFAYAGPYCQGGINPLPAIAKAVNLNTFSASPAGLAFADTNTGEINLAGSKAGTYTVYDTSIPPGGGPASIDSTLVTIDQQALVAAGPDQTLPFGTPVQLAGKISGVSGGRWSGGSGTFSDPTLVNAIYTPTPKETLVKLVLTSADPPGVCGVKTDTLTLTFAIIPPAPIALGLSVCSGSNADLSAVAASGVYQWYSAPLNGTLLSSASVYVTPPLTVNTTYYVQTILNGIASPRTAVLVMVNPIPIPPIVKPISVCSGNPGSLTATGSNPDSYQWYDAAVGGNLLALSGTYVTPGLETNTSYFAQSAVNGCTSTRTKVDVTVLPTPKIISATTGAICSGAQFNYTITSDQPNATFLWSRAQVAGISNGAVTGQTTAEISETLVNISHSDIKVTYIITPVGNSCSGIPFSYVVTVYSTNIITSSTSATICTGNSSNYIITSNTPGIQFYWNRAAVPGISNAAVSVQTADTIREVLFNTTNAPIDVHYIINYTTGQCTGAQFDLKVTVNPAVNITSAGFGTACSGSPQSYTITSNVPSATFTWKRNAVKNISNPAVYNQTSATIDETLINTGQSAYNVFYNITPTAFGCQGQALNYIVAVNPQPAVPVAKSNSPVCTGSKIELNTPSIPKAAYFWTGPDGYTSSKQNPEIDGVTGAQSGTYNLNVIVNGCSSPTASIDVVVRTPPYSNAGIDTLVCISVQAIQLHGSISGGTNKGIWTTNGTGTFFPASDQLKAQYIPSAHDRTEGYITLTLTSASTDDCNLATSDIIIKFGQALAVMPGPDQKVCSQVGSVQLNGEILIPGGGLWSTSGTGTFNPSPSDLNTQYIPAVADVKSGSVKLTLLANDAGQCYLPTGSLIINFMRPPGVNAGGTRYILAGRQITLNPTVSDDKVKYLWVPDTNINDNTLKNPVITGDVDRTYTLTVTDSLGCVSQDQTFIKVAPEIKIPNAFTPNGDGVNDKWDIVGLVAYQQATVDIFNRYGQKIFHSVGYSTPWDGTYNHRLLPTGAYYYVIDTNMFGQILSGCVTLIN